MLTEAKVQPVKLDSSNQKLLKSLATLSVHSSQRLFSLLLGTLIPRRWGWRESFGNCQEIVIGNIWKTTKGITLTYMSLKGGFTSLTNVTDMP